MPFEAVYTRRTWSEVVVRSTFYILPSLTASSRQWDDIKSPPAAVKQRRLVSRCIASQVAYTQSRSLRVNTTDATVASRRLLGSFVLRASIYSGAARAPCTAARRRPDAAVEKERKSISLEAGRRTKTQRTLASTSPSRSAATLADSTSLSTLLCWHRVPRSFTRHRTMTTSDLQGVGRALSSSASRAFLVGLITQRAVGALQRDLGKLLTTTGGQTTTKELRFTNQHALAAGTRSAS